MKKLLEDLYNELDKRALMYEKDWCDGGCSSSKYWEYNTMAECFRLFCNSMGYPILGDKLDESISYERIHELLNEVK